MIVDFNVCTLLLSPHPFFIRINQQLRFFGRTLFENLLRQVRDSFHDDSPQLHILAPQSGELILKRIQ
jgi:hypothetical protein